MTCKWKRGWRECEGQAQRSLSETSSSCMYYISQVSHCQLEPCQVSHPPYNPPLGRLFPGKDDCEKKKAARIRRATRILLAGCQILCFFFRGRSYDWLRIKFRRSRDVWGSAETEAEADSDWHLVAEGTPHPCFSSFKVSLQTYNVWITQKKSNK